MAIGNCETGGTAHSAGGFCMHLAQCVTEQDVDVDHLRVQSERCPELPRVTAKMSKNLYRRTLELVYGLTSSRAISCCFTRSSSSRSVASRRVSISDASRSIWLCCRSCASTAYSRMFSRAVPSALAISKTLLSDLKALVGCMDVEWWWKPRLQVYNSVQEEPNGTVRETQQVNGKTVVVAPLCTRPAAAAASEVVIVPANRILNR
ncbi:hypothetical protein BU16DRAFT_239570 [Lophium mytilinum]|uniref:Uncharacterized protein n=1 Tax=Lophium mytilinum TaxID=390894 RepID=A0A6A6R8Z8_9PEZI|nr:hypothetical protein BU16DRAFT_239570 [Lophium mytilinum]